MSPNISAVDLVRFVVVMLVVLSVICILVGIFRTSHAEKKPTVEPKQTFRYRQQGRKGKGW